MQIYHQKKTRANNNANKNKKVTFIDNIIIDENETITIEDMKEIEKSILFSNKTKEKMKEEEKHKVYVRMLNEACEMIKAWKESNGWSNKQRWNITNGKF